MYAAIFGIIPFGKSTENGVLGIMQSIREDQLEFPFNIENECESILRRMMDKNPTSRITLEELKKHPWLQFTDRLDVQKSEIPKVVEVSSEEINLAFTPINNFILMVRFKFIAIMDGI